MHFNFPLWVVALAAQSMTASVSQGTQRGTNEDDITYMLPIWEGALATQNYSSDLAVLTDMKKRLQAPNEKFTRLGWSFSSFALARDTTGAAGNFTFDPTNIQHEFKLAEDANLPILVHVNNGRWAAGSFALPNGSFPDDTLIEYMAKIPGTTMEDQSGDSRYNSVAGNNYFCLSRLNRVYYEYKQRNVMASGRVIAQWADKHPELFAGVSLDSETLMPDQNADYNPLAVQEWRQWLTHTGLYGPGGDYNGQGRVPSFDAASVAGFNAAMGTSFDSWDHVQPPTTLAAGQVFSEEWQRWRVMMILHHVSDETLWLVQSGIDRNLVYGHQTPQINDYGMADNIETDTAAIGAGGLTFYGWQPDDYPKVLAPLRAQGKNKWANVELNALSSNSSFHYAGLVALFDQGIKLATPNAWEDYTHLRDQYAIHDSPNYGDAWEIGLRDWLHDYAEVPRHTQPSPWSPGRLVFDLYETFSSAASDGPDNHIQANESVGGVVRKAVYEAVGGSITWKTSLPSVKSVERLNFWTSLGIREGAGSNGGPVQFHVTFNGTAITSPGGIPLYQNYFTWKRWVPMMLDVTDWAGKGEIAITLSTTGQQTYGWTTWGAPQIFQSTSSPESLNRAKGRKVQTSSSDKGDGHWDAAYLTDGIVDATSSAIGWSSVLRATEDAEEWVSVDLGVSTNVSKVVLFSRNDASTCHGSGFPRDFVIQTSQDNGSWKDVLVQTDYPGAYAGGGEVYVFPTTTAQHLRVKATKLNGACAENGFRMQLAELEVY